jgi:cell wall assembly regulator SMI1
MENLIERLEKWLKINRPAYYTYLQAGATDSQLDKIESFLGINLPADFRVFYKWKNGQPSDKRLTTDFERFVPGYAWWSLESIAVDIARMQDAEEVGPGWWSKKWVPFLSDETASNFCLDMAGSFNGKVGQILLVWGDDTPRSITHPTFAKWLETIVTAYEKGVIGVNRGNQNICSISEYNQLIRELNPSYPIDNEAEIF